MAEQTELAPSPEERIAELERVVRELASNNNIAKENFASLRNAFDVDLPAAFKAQDASMRTDLAQIDKAIAVLRKHAEGFHQLLDLLDGRLTRLEALIESRKAGVVN